MRTGYVANFRVDLCDKTPIAEMMREVLDHFNVPGIQVYADNAFVSVHQLRWCKDHQINLCDTTRRRYGFPAELCFDDMGVLVCVCCVITNPNPNPNCSQPAAWRFSMANDSRWTLGDGMERRGEYEGNVS